MPKTVSVYLECSAADCGAHVDLDQDVLPAGWWKDDQEREFCPRHKPVVLPRDVEPAEVWDEALAMDASRPATEPGPRP